MREITVKDAATRMGCSIENVYHCIREHRLPAAQWNGLWVIDPTKLDAWIDRVWSKFRNQKKEAE